jgi:hypothetical protein
MKLQIPFTLLLSVLLILTTGCDNNKKKACDVGYKYAYAMANYQVQEAAQYATEETKNTTLVMAERLITAVGEEYVKSDTPAKVKIVKYSQLDDTTAVIDFRKNTPIKKDYDFSLLMRKRNGQWMAHDTIPTYNNEEFDNPSEEEDVEE